MAEDYVWLPKNDNLVKEYEEQNWNVVLIAKILSNETYYCFSKDKHFLTDDLRHRLLTPMCIVNKEYRDCLVLFKDNPDFGFVWQNKKCFSLDSSLLTSISSSSMTFYRDDEKVVVKNVSKLIENTKIDVKSAMSLLPILLGLITLIIIVVIGLYLWLF